jgi:glycine cleavage system regulatory protein
VLHSVADLTLKTNTRNSLIHEKGRLGAEKRSEVVEGVTHVLEEHGVKIVNLDTLEVLAGRAVDDLEERDGGILVRVEAGGDNVDSTVLELTNPLGLFEAGLGASNHHNNLCTV